MANPNKHIRKLREFSAHNGNITCLALGPKSGLVLATGGSDFKVNLWKVDSDKRFMSLTGHVTPIECVQFDASEYLVGAGSQTGGIKIWDLSQGKKVKTFSGHQSAVTKLDFFPFVQSSYFVTGSKDTNVKLWDYRLSHCIGMYKSHDASISSLKYSPDGLWIASGDTNGNIKVWDLRVGQIIHDFGKIHKGTVTSIQFHPLVFLLVSSGTDNTIHVMDLEKFSVISQIDTENSTIRYLQFSDNGSFLYGGGTNFLGVYSVEPTGVFDTVNFKWENVDEFVVKENRIIGASHFSTNVSTWMINLPEEYPNKNKFSPNEKSLKTNTLFTRDSGVRKSFNKQTSRDSIKPKTNMKLIDEHETNFEEENLSFNVNSPFKPNRTLNRSPTELLSESENASSSLETNSNQLTKYGNEIPTKLEERKSCFDVPLGLLGGGHSSYSEGETSSAESQSDTTGNIEYFSPKVQHVIKTSSVFELAERKQNSNVPSSVSMQSVPSYVVNENVSKRPTSLPVFRQNDHFAYGYKYASPQSEIKIKSDEIKSPIHHKHQMLAYENSLISTEFIKTDAMANKFELPVNRFDDLKNNLNNLISDEEDTLERLLNNHKSTMDVLKKRQHHLNTIQTLWTNKSFKSAVSSAISINDEAVIADLISIITQRPKLWCLDTCSMLLPSISDLIQSGNEAFINVSFSAIRDILQCFMPVIKNNIQRPPSAIGVDIMQEERYNKCRICHNNLMDIRSFVLKRQTVQGNLGHVFRQLHMLLQTIDI